jgi:short-subunit dehydrogenase
MLAQTARGDRSGESIAGKIYTPFGGWYHATKFALEGFSDCLRLEVELFGINVVVVEPGGIKTNGALSPRSN